MGTNGGEDESQKSFERQDPKDAQRAGRSKRQFPTVLTLFQGEIVYKFG